MLNWITGVIENVLDFSNVLNISITASWVVLAVLLVRFALKKAPKWIHVALWGIVAVRLLLPFSIESGFSLLPSKETVPSHLMQAQGAQLHDSAHLDIISNPYFPGNVSLELSQSTDRIQISMMLMTFVWLAGIAAMLIYTAVSYVRLRRNVGTAVLLRDNIYQSENVTSPFVLGLLRPTVYVPFKVDRQSLEHIIAHEQAHICRRDYIWKPLGFLLLTIHWFNPVMWIAYILLCRDIELACDEKVIKGLDNGQRADYSQALLDCSVNRWAIAACPLAFGEVGVKERVTSVLNYKKPAFWLIIAAVIVCAVVAVCFLTEPYSSKILYNSRVYQQSGASVEILPENSEQVGTLIGIAHRTSDDPEKEFYATNLDEKYAGCPVYQSGADKGTIYLYDYEGFYIPFVVVVEPGIVNPWVQEYIPGTGNILGSVDKEKYESISEDFAIGADRYGRAVFKNPYKAYDAFVELYAEGIALIREEHNLPAMTSKRYSVYKHYGWQITTGSAEAQAQANFVSKFLDIYENSFDKEPPNTSVEIPTTEAAPTLSLNDVIILSQKGYDLTWEDFSGFEYIETGSGLYIYSYKINDLFSLSIGGTSTEGQPMYIYLHAKDGTDDRIDIRDGGVTEFIEEHRNNTPEESDIVAVFSSEMYTWVGYSPDGYNAMVDRAENRDTERRYGNIEHLTPVVMLETKSEFDDFYREMSAYFQFEQSWVDSGPFSAEAERFDKAFFSENTLLIAYLEEPTTSNRHAIEEVRIENGVLEIRICRSKPQTGDSAMAGWFMSVAVPKETITGCTGYDAYICAEVDPDSVFPSGEPVGTYAYNGGDLTKTATVCLFDDGQFQFVFSPLSSYIAIGSYTIENDRLTLHTHDGMFVYVFDMVDDTLVFDAEASTDRVWYSGITDGSVFMQQ